MGATIELINLSRPADLIAGDLDDGGVGLWLYWWRDGETKPLFSFNQSPSPHALALASAIAARWKSDAELRENFIAWAINIGAACQCVDRPAWTSRPLTAEELEALRRDEQRLEPGESGEVVHMPPRDPEGGAA